MSLFFNVIFLSSGVAMDSLSVSIAGGTRSKRHGIIHAVKVASFFTVFQTTMPVIGWLAGGILVGLLAGIVNWMAFGLLVAIGVRMIYESLKGEIVGEKKDITNLKTLIFLSFATSVDALAVGLTLGLLEIPIILFMITIAIITFNFSFFGFLLGKKLGLVFGRKAEFFGGAILIAIGIKIIAEYLVT